MYCIHCGKEIVGGEAFCMGCGSPIKKAESKKKSDKGLLGLILCIVAILYTLLSFILEMFNQNFNMNLLHIEWDLHLDTLLFKLL